MLNEVKLCFEDLASAREQLRRFCSVHYSSVDSFRDGISFRLFADEGPLEQGARHLSSSATCIESLVELPQQYLPKDADIITTATKFARAALERPQNKWLSDESAHIYCRCRALPTVIRHIQKYDPRIKEHITTVLQQLKVDRTRFAIGEASTQEPNTDNWYPPNAFHTYWTLFILDVLKNKFKKSYDVICGEFENDRFDITRLHGEMLLWAKHVVGQQTALHSSDSSTLDSDQLAWSLAIVIRFDTDFEANLAKQDFIRYAFESLFQHQTKSGSWRTGGPLFHYRKSGNAYCYIFETFTVLLKSALVDRKESGFLRQTLKHYFPKLWNLFGYALSTRIPSLNDAGVVRWNSGHRINRESPESWATATVFLSSIVRDCPASQNLKPAPKRPIPHAISP